MDSLQRNEDINIKIRDRNAANGFQPLLSFYPKSTKYIQQPIVDAKMDQMNLGGSLWNVFANSINIESELKNQFQPFKRNENVYIPDSTSDLYKYPSFSFSTQLNSSDLNDPPLFDRTNKGNIFNNFTRNQMKDMYGVNY